MSKAKEERERPRLVKQDGSTAPIEPAQVQIGLNIPGDTNVPGMPQELLDLLEPFCQVVHESGIAKLQENDYKAKMLELMLVHKIATVALPNGGSFKTKPGKTTGQYVPPPKKSVDGDDTGTDPEPAEESENGTEE